MPEWHILRPAPLPLLVLRDAVVMVLSLATAGAPADSAVLTALALMRFFFVLFMRVAVGESFVLLPPGSSAGSALQKPQSLHLQYCAGYVDGGMDTSVVARKGGCEGWIAVAWGCVCTLQWLAALSALQKVAQARYLKSPG